MTTDTYTAWAHRHPQAAAELAALLTPPVPTVTGEPGSEARVQSEIRIEGAMKGYSLWRNNSGSLPDEHGRPVRFGLGAESKALSEVLASSDLIGWKPTLVTPSMVGSTVAVFVSVECKRPGWHIVPSDRRAHAQAKWLELVARAGGIALFATGVGALP